jgi:meso-butanediol dehydrogenase/(S,S)-butanediol dehydrogenase/diacetyl reductase
MVHPMAIAHGRKALITGGASGFGLAIARRLADSGARVVIADIADEQLARAYGSDPRLVPLRLDVTSAVDVDAVTAAAVRELGGLDTLVLSAGVIHVKPLAEVTERDWDATLDINLKGAFLVAQAAVSALRASGRGRIVAISSDAGKRGYPWIQAYTASKFGLIGLIESLAVELSPDRVTANCVCPASCPTTGMGRSLTAWKAKQAGISMDEMLERMGASFPLGRSVSEGDVVGAVEYLLSEQASFITGVALDVDGGESLGFLQVATSR